MQATPPTDAITSATDTPLLDGLAHANAYAHEIIAVQCIETHISWVLLTGEFAYKIKKPVQFGFLNYATLESRHFFCTEELRLNRRLAPDLYLAVVPITGTVDNPHMDGDGPPLEYAIKMRQFPAGQLLNVLAGQGQLSNALIDQAARLLADFHTRIAQADVNTVYGEPHDIQHWFNENIDQINPLLTQEPQKKQLTALKAWGDKQWAQHTAQMQLRKQQGYVRECHGDLHLGNMTLINDSVTLFDCIEFNPLLRWIDVMSEIAFLMIDLLRYQQTHATYRLLNHYLHLTGDYQGLKLLPYYLVYRALVKAKVGLLRLAQHAPEAATAAPLTTEVDTFITLAEQITQRPLPQLIITHGLSGSGKSTFAAQLAEHIGAIHLRSDSERKRLFGYPLLAQTESGLKQGLYSTRASQLTYQRLTELTQTILAAGFSVIVDATFLNADQREPFTHLANNAGIPFKLLDFQASPQTLADRIQHRQHDVSEATLAVLKQQQHTAQPLSADELTYAIPINTEAPNALALLLNHFQDRAL